MCSANFASTISFSGDDTRPTTSYRAGIDIGSTTAKLVVLNPAADVVFSVYRRHNAQTLETLLSILQEAQAELGDVSLSVQVTGSAGMGITEKFGLPFIQEVIASAEVVRQRYPQVKTLIDIGGEDAKMIFFNPSGPPDMRMNGACAGGTGAFIDQMATLLNIPVAELNTLAQQPHTLYPIASRCGVFAKTDVQNLLSREVSHADIAASIFRAVVLQTLSTLSRGRTARPHILFSGGPLTFLPALKTFFIEALALSPADVVAVDHAELLPALGAALARTEQLHITTLSALSARLSALESTQILIQPRLPRLFNDQADFDGWLAEQARYTTPRAAIKELVENRPCFLGVDSGSTTTKLVLIDEEGRLVFEHYRHNLGNPIQAVREGLTLLNEAFARHQRAPRIGRSIVTGYGEDLIRAAFGFDEGMVETLAHFRAARAFNPNVSFILDIGGQDMKAIFVNNGHIQNIEINEACSSGCGSFIQTFAQSLGYSPADFATAACLSEAPCDLGSRCTVFMNSRVKQSLRERATVGDISAGLAYSVIKNAINKVLKITDSGVLGDHIVAQGGSFRNKAIHKALEILLDRPVLCPDIAELMGAYGAALTARDSFSLQEQVESQLAKLDTLDTVAAAKRQTIHCRGCENQCTITKMVFANNNVFFTGNRCERIYTSRGQKVKTGHSLPARKTELLFNRPAAPTGEDRGVTIGIPRALNMFQNYPFWHTLLGECGFTVRLSDVSTSPLYQRGVDTVMSENICFPAKLVHGHIYNLIEAGVDRIFYPLVTFEQKEFANADNCYNCPIVTGYPEVIQSAINPAGQHHIPLDMPAITFADEALLKKGCYNYLKTLGVPQKTIERAFKQAIAAQQTYRAEVRAQGAEILRRAQAENRPVILLLTRPYHLDPLINHKLPEIITGFGVDVITEDAIPTHFAPLDNRHMVTLWAYPNRYYHAAHWAGKHPGVEVVQLNSFGCGPDAVAVDEVKGILNEYGKSPTVIRIDEIDSPGSARLRLRSMIESLGRNVAAPLPEPKPRQTTRLFEKADRRKTILVPQLSHFYTAPLARPLQDMGYRFEFLPPADHLSVQAGLKYTNNEICYPGIILLGDMIKALQSGKYNCDEIVVGITQTGGQCRDSCYLPLFKKAMTAAGFSDIPIVSLAINPLNLQPGFKVNIIEYVYKLLVGLVYVDALSTMYHTSAIRETTPGQALQLANRYMKPFEDGSLPIKPAPLLQMLSQAVADFNQLPTQPRDCPQVGIVGEIYVKYNPFGNNHVVQWLMSQGVEAVVPSLLEFFMSNFIIWPNNMKANLEQDNPLVRLLADFGRKYINGFTHHADEILRTFKHYRPHHAVEDIARTAEKIVHLTNCYGEGWLIPGEIGEFVKSGVNNVLCLQPFGCLANHITAKGVEKRLKVEYPQLNLLFLDADAGVSEVNFFNRAHFFISHAKETAQS